MDIAQIAPKQGRLEIQGTVTDISEPRTFNKFGKDGKVAKARIKDATGEVTLTLWNEQVDQVKSGDTIKISNGWSDEYQGELQISTGKFGRLEVISAGAAPVKPAQAAKKPVLDEEDIEY